MGEETIQTEVDRLIDILKTKKKVELSKLAKELKVSEDIVQNWVDFLVEEKIVAMDYDLTKPTVSIIEDESKTGKPNENEIQNYKKKFQNDATKQGNVEFLWKQHILENLESMKTFFYSEAETRDLENIDQLWEEFKTKVIQS
ncbi:hypothetical protein KO361_01870 [Candidatus Woesearchaeota archaeon]|nr:hypothetical protein [Candidatus Woesearchaeota archaeon]